MVLCHFMNGGSVMGYHELVGTLTLPYAKGFFELFALIDGRDSKTSVTGACTISRVHILLYRLTM